MKPFLVKVLISLIYAISAYQLAFGTSLCNSDTDLKRALLVEQFIDFPGQQQPVNGLYTCQWRIVTLHDNHRIHVTLEYMNVYQQGNCSAAKLVIYNGDSPSAYVLHTECGDVTGPKIFSSSDEHIFVKWSLSTNETNNFRIIYSSTAKSVTSSTAFQHDNTAVIIAGVILGLVFVAAICLAAVCYCRNRNRMFRHAARRESSHIPYRRERDSKF